MGRGVEGRNDRLNAWDLLEMQPVSRNASGMMTIAVKNQEER